MILHSALAALSALTLTSALTLPRLGTLNPESGSVDSRNETVIEARQAAADPGRYVFAHFMVGFVNGYTPEDWSRDIALAMSYGIDGFAMNCDTQETTTQKLTDAFAAASAAGFKLFLSPDFVHYSYEDPGPVSELLKAWVTQPAYFTYDGRPMVSSFWGEGTDWQKVKENVGSELYVIPYYKASQAAADTPALDGLFSWSTWPGEGSDEIVFANMTTDKDMEYLNLLAPKGHTYMAPVSPWFYSHLPASTGFPKNYHLYSDTLWPTRWQQILDMVVSVPDQLRFVEIITWNDWTECSLITPYRGTMEGDGNKEWAADFDHTAMMDMMGPFISAFKAGQGAPNVQENKMVWWYRPTLKNAECTATDTVGEKPRGWEMATDSIFVAALTTGPATITVTAGSTSSAQQVEGAGVHTLAFPMAVGAVSFQMDVEGGGSAVGQGAIQISDQCYNGIYNFNILAGSATCDGAAAPLPPVQSSAPNPSASAPISTPLVNPIQSSGAESVPPVSGEPGAFTSAPVDGGPPTSVSPAPTENVPSSVAAPPVVHTQAPPVAPTQGPPQGPHSGPPGDHGWTRPTQWGGWGGQ